MFVGKFFKSQTVIGLDFAGLRLAIKSNTNEIRNSLANLFLIYFIQSEKFFCIFFGHLSFSKSKSESCSQTQSINFLKSSTSISSMTKAFGTFLFR